MSRDAGLVGAALAGREDARRELFRSYNAVIHRLATRLMGAGADADDLAQEAFMHAFSSLPSLRDQRLFGPWLYSIVVRQAHKTQRRRRRRLALVVETNDPRGAEGVAATMAPDVALEVKLACHAVAELPPVLREPLLLYRVDGMQLGPLAEALHISLATLKRRLSRAIASVEAVLERSGSRHLNESVS